MKWEWTKNVLCVPLQMWKIDNITQNQLWLQRGGGLYPRVKLPLLGQPTIFEWSTLFKWFYTIIILCIVGREKELLPSAFATKKCFFHSSQLFTKFPFIALKWFNQQMWMRVIIDKIMGAQKQYSMFARTLTCLSIKRHLHAIQNFTNTANNGHTISTKKTMPPWHLQPQKPLSKLLWNHSGKKQ